MDGLAAQIRKDWFVIEESANDPNKIIALFKPGEHELETIIRDLGDSVEEGIFEYKRSAVRSMLRPLESLQYDSRAIEFLPKQIEKGKAVLLVTLLQRLYLKGELKPKDSRPLHGKIHEEQKTDQTGVKEILTFVREMLNSDPEKKKDPEVKKIIMYSKMYQNEVQKLADLTKTVPPGKIASVKENFRNSLSEIIGKMNIAYNNLTESPADMVETRPKTGSILKRFNYSPLSGEIKKQAAEFSKVLSTLVFAEKEKFNTREILVALSAKQNDLLKLVDNEQSRYTDIAPFDKKGLSVSRELVKEISGFLKKEKEWLKLHPW